MKHIKLFEDFKDSNLEDIRDMLVHYDIENFIVNIDGTVDVYGDVNLGYYKLKTLRFPKLDKIPFKFGKVSGTFTISNNYLTSLEGCPYYVGGDFDISMNKIESFKFGPDEVEGTVYASSNKFKSLEFMPSEIKYDFIVYNNPLKELDSVSNIEGDIFCDPNLDKSKFRGYCQNIHDGSIEAEGLPVASALNENLENKYTKGSDLYSDLEDDLDEYGIKNYTINEDGTIDVNGNVRLTEYCMIGFRKLLKIPFKFREVSGNFDISNNLITSLQGSPIYVGGAFLAYGNELESLVGGPEEVVGDYDAYTNKLNSLDGLALEIGGCLNLIHNNIKELDSMSNIEGKIYCDKEVDISKFRGYCKQIMRRKV